MNEQLKEKNDETMDQEHVLGTEKKINTEEVAKEHGHEKEATKKKEEDVVNDENVENEMVKWEGYTPEKRVMEERDAELNEESARKTNISSFFGMQYFSKLLLLLLAFPIRRCHSRTNSSI